MNAAKPLTRVKTQICGDMLQMRSGLPTAYIYTIHEDELWAIRSKLGKAPAKLEGATMVAIFFWRGSKNLNEPEKTSSLDPAELDVGRPEKGSIAHVRVADVQHEAGDERRCNSRKRRKR